MNWESHRYWCAKLDISAEVADYVNRVIDLSDPDDLPADYQQAVVENAENIAAHRGTEHGNSALGLVIAETAMTHDAGRRQTTRGNLSAECTLQFLRQKGSGYVKAWYLHHHLDYLNEQKNSGSSFQELLQQYRQKYPEAYSRDIETFLCEFEQELTTKLGLPVE